MWDNEHFRTKKCAVSDSQKYFFLWNVRTTLDLLFRYCGSFPSGCAHFSLR